MEVVVTVICTGGDKKKHTRHTFNTVIVTDDSVRPNVLRQTDAPELAGNKIDGIAVPGYVLIKDYNPRYGAAGWRWVCPVCKQDQQWNDEASVREWLLSCGPRADIARRR